MINIFNFNKKAQAAKNLFIGLTFLITFAMLSLIGVLLTTQVLSTIQSSSIYDAGTMAVPISHFQNTLNVFDYLTALFMVVFIIGIAVTSFRLATAPIFFVVTFFMSAIYGFVAYIMNYTFIQFVSNTIFTTIYASFPVTILICTNLHWVALANIVIGAIALYAKKPQGQTGEILR